MHTLAVQNNLRLGTAQHTATGTKPGCCWSGENIPTVSIANLYQRCRVCTRPRQTYLMMGSNIPNPLTPAGANVCWWHMCLAPKMQVAKTADFRLICTAYCRAWNASTNDVCGHRFRQQSLAANGLLLISKFVIWAKDSLNNDCDSVQVDWCDQKQ